MSVVEESGVLSPANPTRGLGSPIADELINIDGDGNVFARFIRFLSDGIVDLAERPPQAERSHDHQVRSQRCVRFMGPFRSPLPYDLKTGILYKLSVTQGKCRKESCLFEEGSSGYPVIRSDDEDREEVAWD